MSKIKTGTTTTTGYQVESDSTGELVIQTGSTPTTAVTINSSQNVGIGTASPVSKLTTGGETSAYPSSITITATAHATSRRAGILAGDWVFGQDSNGNGTKDFFFYGGTSPSPKMVIDTSGNLLFNSGYGSVANAYGCRAWVNFNGTGTVAIRASGNVTSITDNGVGNYTVNFTTAMPDTNYSVAANGASATANRVNDVGPSAQSKLATTSVGINSINNANGAEDIDFVSVSIHR